VSEARLWRVTLAARSSGELHRVNHGARRGGEVLGGTARESRRNPGELRAHGGLNNRRGNSNLRREQSPEGAAFGFREDGPSDRLAVAMAPRVLRRVAVFAERPERETSGGHRAPRGVTALREGTLKV